MKVRRRKWPKRKKFRPVSAYKQFGKLQKGQCLIRTEDGTYFTGNLISFGGGSVNEIPELTIELVFHARSCDSRCRKWEWMI